MFRRKAAVIIAVLISFSLFCFFPLSVCAADSWHFYDVTPESWDTEAVCYYTYNGQVQTSYLETKGLANGVYQFNLPAGDFMSDDGIVNFYYTSPVALSLVEGDTFSLSSFTGYVWAGGTDNLPEAVRVVVSETVVNELFATEWVENTAGTKSFNFSIPDATWKSTSAVTVRNIVIQVRLRKTSNGYLNIRPPSFTVGYGNYMFYEQLLEQKKTNDKLDETNDKLDELLEQPEKEKDEASGTGNDGVGELTGVIPDYSTGFIDGMQRLANSLSYSGTKCEWTVPQLYIPSMTGVSSQKIPLTDGELKVDLGSWVQKLPNKILSVIRVLLTIALIIYCVKELYDTVQYALTLKSGGN